MPRILGISWGHLGEVCVHHLLVVKLLLEALVYGYCLGAMRLNKVVVCEHLLGYTRSSIDEVMA